MKIYIAGKITGDPNYRAKFTEAEERLRGAGHIPMHSANLSQGFEHKDYMHICEAMIDVCEAVVLLPDWCESPGAQREITHTARMGKRIFNLWEVGVHERTML